MRKHLAKDEARPPKSDRVSVLSGWVAAEYVADCHASGELSAALVKDYIGAVGNSTVPFL